MYFSCWHFRSLQTQQIGVIQKIINLEILNVFGYIFVGAHPGPKGGVPPWPK